MAPTHGCEAKEAYRRPGRNQATAVSHFAKCDTGSNNQPPASPLFNAPPLLRLLCP